MNFFGDVQRVNVAAVADDTWKLLVFAPGASAMRWIREELDGESVTIAPIADVRTMIAALGTDGGDAATLMVIDFDSLHPEELVDLQLLGRQDWSGTIIALGDVPPELERAFAIRTVVRRPLGSEVLRQAVGEALATSIRTRLPTDPI